MTSLIDTKLPTERTTEDSTADVGVNALLRELQQCLQTYIQDPPQSAIGTSLDEDTNAPEPTNPRTLLNGLPFGSQGEPSSSPQEVLNPQTSLIGLPPSSRVQEALNEFFEHLLGNKTERRPPPTANYDHITVLKVKAFFHKKPVAVPTAADYTKLGRVYMYI